MTTDTIADMLTRIRNANLAKHQVVQIPSTKITKNIDLTVPLASAAMDSPEPKQPAKTIEVIKRTLMTTRRMVEGSSGGI